MARRKNSYIFAPETHRKKGPGCIVLFFSVALAVVVVSLLSNFAMNSKVELQTQRVPVMSLEKAYEGLTLLHISDLQADEVGLDAEAWRTLLFGQRFDAVVFTGDMVGTSGNYGPLLSLIKTLSQINTAAPIYFVAGDEDPTPVISSFRGTTEVYADWVLQAKDAGAIYLDAPVSQEIKGKVVWFVPEYLYSVDTTGMLQSLTTQKEDMETRGQQYEAEGGASYRALVNRLDAMDRSVEAIKTMTDKDLQIAVTHVPLTTDYIRTAIEWADQTSVFSFRGVDLVLAGHFVGGQWRLFGAGPLYVPDMGWLPGDEGIMGMQRINSVNQYISPGVGASGFYPMPGRLFNRPAVTALIFTARIE